VGPPAPLAYATWQVARSDIPGSYDALLYAPSLEKCALTSSSGFIAPRVSSSRRSS